MFVRDQLRGKMRWWLFPTGAATIQPTETNIEAIAGEI
jgi:hypothetical protein